MSDSFSSKIRVTVGKTAQALHWLTVIFSFEITLGETMVQPGSGDGSGQSASKSGACGCKAHRSHQEAIACQKRPDCNQGLVLILMLYCI